MIEQPQNPQLLIHGVMPRFSSVLSLFDGMSCGQIALNRVGIEYDNYFASEIDKHAIKVTQTNYPNTIQLGDVTKVKAENLPKIELLIGGSPCQGFSFAGKGLNFDDPRSKLFFEFVRILKETKPKYFLLENVKMEQEFQDIISEQLGVKPILINSSLVSAQNRERLYWTNIPITELPTDKGILLKDIIEIGEPIKDKSQTILATLYKENAKSMIKRNKAGLLVKMSSENPLIKELSITDRGIRPHRNDKRKSGISEIGTIHYPDTKSYTITANHAPKVLTEIIGWRKLTPKECERLQTVPDNYTECVSDTQRYKMLGNGWTVDVIAHIFGSLLNGAKRMLADGLSLDQAKTTAIVEGRKIKHRYFMDYEFIYYKSGCWFTEDNYQIPDSYWKNMDENWQNGWSYVD